MKKHLLRMFMTALCMMAMNAITAKQLYVVGTDNVWDTSKYASTLDEKDGQQGVYEGTIVLANSSSWFAVVDQMSETANDWDEFNKHRYGMKSADSMTPMPTNQAINIVYGYDENSTSHEVSAFYYNQAGTFTFTIDTNNMTATISDGTGITYPDCVYVLGCDNVWNPSAPSATLTRSILAQGVYEGDVTMTNTYFALGTALGSNASDWSTFNASRYAPEQIDQLLPVGQPLPLVKGEDRSFMVASTGDYHLSVDLTAMTVTLTSTGGLPEQLYIIDTTPETPDYATPLATLAQTAQGSGVYTGTVTFAGNQFALTSKTGDVAAVYENCYCRAVDNQYVHINEANAIYCSPKMLQLEDCGTYDIKVDLVNGLAYFNREGYVPAYPYTLTVTDENGVSRILYDNYKKHVYIGSVTTGTGLYSISSDNGTYVSLAAEDGTPTTSTLWTNTTRAVATSTDAPAKMYLEGAEGETAYMTVDLDNNCMVLYGGNSVYPVGYPNELYVIGDKQGWHYNMPQCVLKETTESGVYEGEVSLYNGAYFGVLQRLGNDWYFANDKRLVPASDGSMAEAGQELNFSIYDIESGDYTGAWMFSGEDGTYNMTVDLRTYTLKLSEKKPSGINGVAEAAESAQQPLYDLSGRRVSGKTAPGIYVQKGKKMVVK